MRKHLKQPSPAMGVALIALFIALGGTTYAATGGNFILGSANTATSQTALAAPIANKTLQVTNTSTTAGATALGLNVAAGKAPFTVNSGTKVANLNADKLDGLDSTAFLRTAHLAAVSTTGGCSADGRVLTACATATITLARPGRLLLNATSGWYTNTLDDVAPPGDTADDPTLVRGSCNLAVDGTSVDSYQSMGERQQSGVLSNHPAQAGGGTMALTGLSWILSVGAHTVEVDCLEQDGDLDWSQMNLTVALVDDDSALGAAAAVVSKTAGAPDKSDPGK
jgi:hypothetical protein